MKNLFSVVTCLLISVLWQGASAQQWIIDGKQTQVLKLEVSDPQAVHTDGSRVMQAPLVYSQACSTPTSGYIRVYNPVDDEYTDLFMIDRQLEAISLCRSSNLGLLIGGRVMIGSDSVLNLETLSGMLFDDHLLKGGWNVDVVPDSPDAIMSRSYADGRYLRKPGGITTNRVIQAGNTLVISNGLITAILP